MLTDEFLLAELVALDCELDAVRRAPPARTEASTLQSSGAPVVAAEVPLSVEINPPVTRTPRPRRYVRRLMEIGGTPTRVSLGASSSMVISSADDETLARAPSRTPIAMDGRARARAMADEILGLGPRSSTGYVASYYAPPSSTAGDTGARAHDCSVVSLEAPPPAGPPCTWLAPSPSASSPASPVQPPNLATLPASVAPASPPTPTAPPTASLPPAHAAPPAPALASTRVAASTAPARRTMEEHRDGVPDVGGGVLAQSSDSLMSDAGFAALREVFGCDLELSDGVVRWVAACSYPDDDSWVAAPASAAEKSPFFVDDDFFPGRAAFGEGLPHQSVPWVRLWGRYSDAAADPIGAEEAARERWCLTASTDALVGRALQPGAILDRRLCDALSAVACYPRVFESLFPDMGPGAGAQELNQRGVYAVRLYCGGGWRVVVIDDYLPRTVDGALLLARPLSAADSAAPAEVWGPLCEKAIAKLSDSYAACEALELDTALELITGGVPFHVRAGGASGADAGPAQRDQTWQRMLECVAEASVVVCTRPGPQKRDSEGAYGGSAAPRRDVVLDCVVRDREQIVVLHALRRNRAERNIREVPFAAFYAQLSELHIARMLSVERDGGAWCEHKVMTQWVYATSEAVRAADSNDALRVCVTALPNVPCSVVLSVALWDRRFRTGDCSVADIPPMAVLLNSSDVAESQPQSVRLGATPPALPRPSASMQTTVRAGESCVFCPLPRATFVGSVIVRVYTRAARDVTVLNKGPLYSR